MTSTTTDTKTTAWQRCDGSTDGVDVVLAALREIEADSPYAVMTTVDPHTKRPVSRAVRISDYPASADDFRTMRVVSRADTRKVCHANAQGATACVAYLSPERNACFTLTGRVAVSRMEDATTQNLACAEPVPKHAFGTRPFSPDARARSLCLGVIMRIRVSSFFTEIFLGKKRRKKVDSPRALAGDACKVMIEIDVDTIEVVSHGHKLSSDLDGRQPIVLSRGGAIREPCS